MTSTAPPPHHDAAAPRTISSFFRLGRKVVATSIPAPLGGTAVISFSPGFGSVPTSPRRGDEKKVREKEKEKEKRKKEESKRAQKIRAARGIGSSSLDTAVSKERERDELLKRSSAVEDRAPSGRVPVRTASKRGESRQGSSRTFGLSPSFLSRAGSVQTATASQVGLQHLGSVASVASEASSEMDSEAEFFGCNRVGGRGGGGISAASSVSEKYARENTSVSASSTLSKVSSVEEGHEGREHGKNKPMFKKMTGVAWEAPKALREMGEDQIGELIRRISDTSFFEKQFEDCESDLIADMINNTRGGSRQAWTR